MESNKPRHWTRKRGSYLPSDPSHPAHHKPWRTVDASPNDHSASTPTTDPTPLSGHLKPPAASPYGGSCTRVLPSGNARTAAVPPPRSVSQPNPLCYIRASSATESGPRATSGRIRIPIIVITPPDDDMPPPINPQRPVAEQTTEDIEAMLERFFWEAVGDDDLDAITYKPPMNAQQVTGAKEGKESKAWGGKGTSGTGTPPTATSGTATPNKSQSIMANGQDFWVEARKQVMALVEKENREKERERSAAEKGEKRGG